MTNGVFLDRDGVINELVISPITGKGTSPKKIEDLRIFPYAVESLLALQKAGYELFIVSNQPDFARGKCKLDEIQIVNDGFDEILSKSGVKIKKFYYCLHHPNGIVPEYSIACNCRKPKPGSLLDAAKSFNINLVNSWMIGDQDTDIECGKAAKTKTIQVRYPLSTEWQGQSNPDYNVKTLKEAADIILANADSKHMQEK